ncbi:betaine--homocysteine S-methyltransferase 1-like [Rattus rattus]|uniref:betaine--homocysteine S-methyltransferase 1-like n=1 Tax=Rattus rattus TaxID=10117 RepID=UPI0013F38D32|nr:betaine--homocysteine S-methyltransferase 1-like [Rattus rattus]
MGHGGVIAICFQILLASLFRCHLWQCFKDSDVFSHFISPREQSILYWIAIKNAVTFSAAQKTDNWHLRTPDAAPHCRALRVAETESDFCVPVIRQSALSCCSVVASFCCISSAAPFVTSQASGLDIEGLPEAIRRFCPYSFLALALIQGGSNVMQIFTFYASEDKLENRGNYVAEKISGQKINEAACDIARQVADERDALVAGGMSQTPSYLSCRSETEVKKIFHQQLEVFMKKNVDFLIAEYFEHIEEAVWVVEALKTPGKPIAATICIRPEGDLHGVSPGECTVRLVKAGAAIVGVNLYFFDPSSSLQTIKLMKEGLEAARLKAYLMSQPLANHTPDCGKQGFIDLPEFPFGLESRVATRWDIRKYAREAYILRVRNIGDCCGFEPYHIKAIAEELAPERGFLPPASEKHGSWGSGLDMHTKPWSSSFLSFI